MQFLLENRMNGSQIVGWFGFLKTESEPNFGFPHIPKQHHCCAPKCNSSLPCACYGLD